jgi:hypothetical protein
MKRFLSVLLTLALLLGALGCGGGELRYTVKQTAQTLPQESTGGYAITDTYFEGIDRSDVAYADMEYDYYTLEDFAPYAEAIESFAQSGGAQEDFDAADEAALAQYAHAVTLINLASIRFDADPSSSEAYDEYLRISSVTNACYDAYFAAMQAVASSDYSSLLKSRYDSWMISWFAEYEPASDEDFEQYDLESQLEQEYYSLMAAENPDYSAIADVYVQLVSLRNDQAAAYGYSSYADYAYDSIYGRTYTPEDSEALWAAVKEYFVPLIEKYGYDAGMAAADYSDKVDTSAQTILSSMKTSLAQMSPELESAFDYMVEYGLYDIEYSADKSDTGYTVFLYEYGEPFVFNAAYDYYTDYTNAFHEFGHFVSYFYNGEDAMYAFADNDICELQSQGMEVMFSHFYDDIFGEEGGEIFLRDMLMNLVYSVVDGAMWDEFQQRIYAEDELSYARIQEIFEEVYASYGYAEYDGYETYWAEVPHNFSSPFYYISYAVSALPSLELFELMQDSFSGALDTYLTIAAIDPSYYYFDDVMDYAGLSDVFSEGTVREIAETAEKYLTY